MNKILSIIIPVYNKWNFTKSCLNDLSKLPLNHEIIIVDNASTDETKIELPKLLNQYNYSFIRNEENTFHSKACNQGFKIATGENVLFLNNDIRVKSNHDNWTQFIIDDCISNTIVGPTMGVLDNELNFIKESNAQLSGNSYLSGWCVAANRDTWNKVAVSPNQIWNEEYPFYFNDVDLSFRAKRKNITLKIIDVPITHFRQVSAKQLNINKLYNEGRKVFVNDWK